VQASLRARGRRLRAEAIRALRVTGGTPKDGLAPQDASAGTLGAFSVFSIFDDPAGAARRDFYLYLALLFPALFPKR
jgi:hypothetical protein